MYISFVYLIYSLLKKYVYKYTQITVKVVSAYPRAFELEYTGSCNLSDYRLRH